MTVRSRLVLFLVSLVAAVLFLLPTLLPAKMPEQWISKPLNLGLDLKGGVHLLYQVVTEEAVKSRLLNAGQGLRSELRKEKIAVTKVGVSPAQQLEIQLLTTRSIDKAKEIIAKNYPQLGSVGERTEGDRPTLSFAFSQGEVASIQKESVRQALETLRSRVDLFGVAEPLLQQVGSDRILLQMPGVEDVEAVKKVVGSVAKLEFRLVANGPGDSTVKLKRKSGGEVLVEDVALMGGEAVDTARSAILNGQVEVSLTLTSTGAQTFRRITTDNVGRQLAIVLDNVVYSDPRINEPIPGGQASISGGFTLEEARQLGLVLRSGALPAPLKVLEERTVGPGLGKDSITAGVRAILVGFGLIVVFMVFYYKKSGVVASISLLLNLFFLIALLSAFGATLTLPGLAGLALTAGMAVDSNVIIFERIRDELKVGAGRDAAVLAGFEKAWSAILDSNVTTLLAAGILYALGTGPIRGFAVSLGLGVATTIYCAIFVSRLAFDTLQLKGKKNLSI